MNYLTDKDFYVNLIHTFGDGYIYNLKDVERQDLKKKVKNLCSNIFMELLFGWTNPSLV